MVSEPKLRTLAIKATDDEHRFFKMNLNMLCGQSSNARERFIKLNKLISDELGGSGIIVDIYEDLNND